MGGVQKRTRPRRKDEVYTPNHPTTITGTRTPSSMDLQAHFALYRGTPMSAVEIGIRLNCPPPNVLTVLLQLAGEGFIERSGNGDTVTADTPWKIAAVEERSVRFVRSGQARRR